MMPSITKRLFASVVLALAAVYAPSLIAQNALPSSGNVGIGTTSPLAKLEIVNYYSSGVDSIRLNYTDAGNSNYQMGIQPFVIGAGNVGYKFTTSNIGVQKDALYLTGDGRVGAGTFLAWDRLAATGSFGVYSSSNGGVVGNNFIRLTAGSTADFVFTRSVNTWSDTWWKFSMGTDNALRLDFCSVPQLTFKNGLLGIKTDTPQRPLDVNGSVRLADGAALEWGGITASISGTSASNALLFSTAGVERFRVAANGNLGVNTSNPTDTLSVNGRVRAREVVVETANWPDFVFDKGYALGSLKEVAAFIEANRHLPGLPSAREVEKEGLAMGEMQKCLLLKIEELVLHQIALEKRVNFLEHRNAELETKLHEQ